MCPWKASKVCCPLCSSFSEETAKCFRAKCFPSDYSGGDVDTDLRLMLLTLELHVIGVEVLGAE